MEGGFGFPMGGDPDDLMRGLREFAEKQAESVAEAQREQFATLTLNTAVQLTAAALGQLHAEGGPDEQAIALRDACRLFPRRWPGLRPPARFMRESVELRPGRSWNGYRPHPPPFRKRRPPISERTSRNTGGGACRWSSA